MMDAGRSDSTPIDPGPRPFSPLSVPQLRERGRHDDARTLEEWARDLNHWLDYLEARASSGESNTPLTLVDRAADRGMAAIADVLWLEGAEAHQIFVIVRASRVPGGEPDCTVAGHASITRKLAR